MGTTITINKRVWQQCPSVCTSGKDYFYVSFDTQGKLSVVWDRIDNCYTITRNDNVIANRFLSKETAFQYVETNPVETGTPDDVLYYEQSWREYQKALKKGLDERGI